MDRKWIIIVSTSKLLNVKFYINISDPSGFSRKSSWFQIPLIILNMGKLFSTIIYCNKRIQICDKW